MNDEYPLIRGATQYLQYHYIVTARPRNSLACLFHKYVYLDRQIFPVRVDLNEEYVSVFFRYFPEISVYYPTGKKQEIPKIREDTETKQKKSPR